MKKIISEIQLAKFSYENCLRKGHINDEKTEYLATVNENFISLRSYQCEEALKTNPNPLGWKFHISIDDEEENLILAWNVIVPILIENKISFTKFMRPKGQSDDTRHNYERGRQFTIYIAQNYDKTPKDWQVLINQITDKLVSNNIKPGYINLVAKAVPGSSYFSYRNDKPRLPEAEVTHVVGSSLAMPPKPELVPDNNPHLALHSKIENSPVSSAISLQAHFSSPLTQKPASASDATPLTVPSPTLAVKSDQTAENPSPKAANPKKSHIVPKLNLPGAVPIPSWTKTKSATAKEIYLDNSIEKKYNPSNSEESFLLTLRVDSKQPQPKEHPLLQSHIK